MRKYFTKKLKHAFEPTDQIESIKKRVSWYVQIRWLLILSIAVPGILSQLIPQGITTLIVGDILLACLALLLNYVFYFLSHHIKSTRGLTVLGIILIFVDIAMITFLIFTKGGIESRSAILYTVPILLSSLLFGRKGLYITTFSTVFAYDSLLILDWANIINSVGAINPSLKSDTPYLINSIAFFTSVLLLIGLLSDFVVGLLESSQRAIESQAKSLSRALDIAKMGNWEWNLKKNKVIWNKELYKLFGLKQDQFKPTYKSYLNLLSPKDRKLASEIIKNSANSGQSFKFDHKLNRKDGKIIWIHSEGIVEKDNNGNPYRMTGTAQDITERKVAEIELINKAEELERLNTLMVGRELTMVELKKKLNKKKSDKN